MKKFMALGLVTLLSVFSVNSTFANSKIEDVCGGDIIFSAQDINHKTQIDVCLQDENTIYLTVDSTKPEPGTPSDQFDFVYEGNPRTTSWLDNSTDLTIASLIKFTNKPQKEKYVISAGKNSKGEVYGFFYIYSAGKAPVKTPLDPKTIKSYILSLEDSNFPETE